MASSPAEGANGKFMLRRSPRHPVLSIVISNGMGWEHVSVSAPGRCPTWEEMSWVKETFWEPEDAVMQLHPPQSEYVNWHPYCLHLWRPLLAEIPVPPSVFVGPK